MKISYILPLILSTLSLCGQDSKKVKIVELDTLHPQIGENFVKEIKIEMTSIWKVSDRKIKKQIKDSTRLYGGNFFNIRYRDNGYKLKKKSYHVIGDIYALTKAQIDNKDYKLSSKEILSNTPRKKYEVSVSLGIGGESKVALFPPRFHFNRINQYSNLNHYFGFGIGIHPHFLGGWGTFHLQTGIEYKKIDLEASVSHLWTTSYEVDDSEIRGPWFQNLVNFKIGYLYNYNYNKVRLVISRVISDHFPDGQQGVFFLNFGRTGDFIFGLEFTRAISY